MDTTAPNLERHARRSLVEQMMLDGARTGWIIVAVQERWPATKVATIWRDMKLVRDRWRTHTSRRLSRKRDSLLARMEETERQARSDGNYSAAAALQAWQAKILGMLNPDSILVALQAGNVYVNTPLPEIADAFLRTFKDQFGDPPEQKILDAELIERPKLNGHVNGQAGTNGHASNGHAPPSP